MSTPAHPVPTGTTELLRGCYHGQFSRMPISETAQPKNKCPRGPPCLEPGAMHTKSRSEQKIYKIWKDIFGAILVRNGYE